MRQTIQLSGFPPHVTAEAVKEFLERYTGNGTVYALKIRNQKRKPRRRAAAFAVVQFTTATSAEHITALVKLPLGLRYGGYRLKVWVMRCDLVPKPRPSIFILEHARLHFGCQVSDDQLSVLWSADDVMVNFGFELRQIYFFLSYGGVRYKLELSYEQIWQIQLRSPHGQTGPKFLLIQVVGVPMIYEKAIHSSGLSYEDPALDYFTDNSNDQWDRATDFTHSFCIGQSSAMCLELSCSCELLDFKEHFFYYKEDDGQFVLKSGSAFSRNMDVVPIVGPPDVPELQRFPFKILFKVCSLVQNGCLAGPTLDADFYKLVHPAHYPVKYIEHALDKLYDLKECCYNPVKWLLEQYKGYRKSNRLSRSRSVSLGYSLVYVRRVQITPSKVYFHGPEVIVSNRVLRKYFNYIDNFIRVSFVDEDFGKMYSTDLSPGTSSASEERRTGIYKRILSILRSGLVVGEKRFDFLAFSSSQLRDNSAWMFAKTDDGLTAASIRDWMGDFRAIRNVAKYAARLGQSFSSSTATLNVAKHEFENISDIELQRGQMQYVFSDGIGKISADFAARVANKCGLKGSTPSAFQIRYGGYKGVVAVDPTSTMKLSLRKSMWKYTSEDTKLDVLVWSKYQPCFLNRQIITLLSTLGVKDDIFLEKQKHVVDKLDAILTDRLSALEALEQMSSGENSNILKEMLMCGYEPGAEPYLLMMLQTFQATKLHELRTKTRIFIPNGRSLMGCLDETGTLEYGQVFIQVSSKWHMFGGNESDQNKIVIQGNVTVAKNPCLHPGDVRVLQAIDVPALNHMVDCIVFPQKGARPHPNECSGSDLDGDMYFVTWDTALIPPCQIQPMEYVPLEAVSLDYEVTIEQVQEYFTNYIVNESLGIIANAHTVWADTEPNKAESNKCMKLARLFSIAVDFPKTGVPAEIPDDLHVREYPDFMEKLDKPTYESRRVIGKLYREIKSRASHTSFSKFTQEVARRSYDPDMEFEGFEDFIDDAYYYKGEYDSELRSLMNHYGIKTEAQILNQSTTKTVKSFSKKWDPDAIGLAVKSLKKKARRWFDKGFESGSTPDKVFAKASAWYHVTYHPDYWGCYNGGINQEHYLSFPWCVYDKLIKIKKDKSSIIRSLECHFSDLRLS